MPEAEKRDSDRVAVGRQFPTQSVVLPYTQTKGGEAILLYDQSSRKTMEWQQSMLYDIMATDDDGLWVHIKFGYSIPRRNGKSEILIIRADWGVSNERRVLYTAHRTTTSHNAWEKCVAQLTTDGKKGWCKRLHQPQLLYYSLSVRVSP